MAGSSFAFDICGEILKYPRIHFGAAVEFACDQGLLQ